MWGEVGLDVLEEDHEALLLALRAGATTGGHPAPLNRGAAAAPEEGAAGRRSGAPRGASTRPAFFPPGQLTSIFCDISEKGRRVFAKDEKICRECRKWLSR